MMMMIVMMQCKMICVQCFMCFCYYYYYYAWRFVSIFSCRQMTIVIRGIKAGVLIMMSTATTISAT